MEGHLAGRRENWMTATYVHKQGDRLTDRLTDRQGDRQTGKQAGRASRMIHKFAGRPVSI